MKVALVYDRVNKWGGAERVLLALHEMFPEAPLYTSVYNPDTARWAKEFRQIYTSFLQNFPPLRNPNLHHLSAPFLPLAMETFNFSDYDLVISVSSEAAKGIITKPGTRHVCYLLTPTRYLWSDYDLYFRSPIRKFISKPVVNYLRKWDRIAAQRPDVVVGISQEVVERIRRYYGREAELIYPPVDLKVSQVSQVPQVSQGDYFLVVSRLVPYKKVDLVIEAFNRLGKTLVVVGTGSEEGKLRRMAKDNVRFIGEVKDEVLVSFYQESRAFIFPQEEDFGIVAVEAQAAGKAVIAYRGGGALDTVLEEKTGLFFDEHTPESLIETIEKFEKKSFSPLESLKNAKKFSRENFFRKFGKLISTELKKHEAAREAIRSAS